MNVAANVRIRVGNVTVTQGKRNGIFGWHVTPDHGDSHWTLYYSHAISLAEALNIRAGV